MAGVPVSKRHVIIITLLCLFIALVELNLMLAERVLVTP